VVLDRDEQIVFSSVPSANRVPQLRRAQALAPLIPGVGARLTIMLLVAKLEGQARVLRGRRGSSTELAADAIEAMARSIESGSPPDGQLDGARRMERLRGIEANAAAVYWDELDHTPLGWDRRDRIPAHWRTLGPRSSS
jgi:CRISPR/Cas system-associated endonuclease Cas1